MVATSGSTQPKLISSALSPGPEQCAGKTPNSGGLVQQQATGGISSVTYSTFFFHSDFTPRW